MICPFCKKAGELNAEANRISLNSVAVADIVRVEVRDWHGRCSIKNCTCQHIVGTVLDWKQILDLKAAGSKPPSADVAQQMIYNPTH